jgi:hypothetical protein
MKSKLLATIMLLTLATSILTFAMYVSPANAANENVKVYIDPPLVNKVPGEVDSFFDVFVTIENVTGLFGFDIRVSWNNNLLTLDSTAKDTYFNTLWPDGWQIALENASSGGGGGGGGGYKLVALSTNTSFTKDPGAQVLFAMHFKIIKSCNFILETPFYFDLVKLSDKNYSPILHTTENGLYHMALTIPDLEFERVDTTPAKPFEYCKTFQIKVYVTHICANLKDYNLVILYDIELLKLTGVDWTDGVLGGSSDGASYTELTPGTITVVDTGGLVWSGLKGLLFTLTFHIEFDDRIEHIWRTGTPKELTAHISFQNAELSFLEGTIPMSGITMPLAQNIIVHLIQGDVSCDGKVDIDDLRSVAAYYDQTMPTKYDLAMDGTIDIFDLVVVATNFWYGKS